MESAIVATSGLEQRILNASIPIDLPRLNAVEVIGLIEIIRRHAENLGRFGDRWLHFALFIGAARLQHGFFAVPFPGQSKSRMRVSVYGLLKLCFLVSTAAVNR